MTDALVGCLDATAAEGLAALPGRTVVQPPGPMPQRAEQLPDRLSGWVIAWRQGCQPRDRPVPIAPEPAGHYGFHPCVLVRRVSAERQACHLMHVLPGRGRRPGSAQR